MNNGINKLKNEQMNEGTKNELMNKQINATINKWIFEKKKWIKE